MAPFWLANTARGQPFFYFILETYFWFHGARAS
jgi:hypothetical protein